MELAAWHTESLAYILLLVTLTWAHGWKVCRGLFWVQIARTSLKIANDWPYLSHRNAAGWWADINHLDMVLDLALFRVLAGGKSRLLESLSWGYFAVLCGAIYEYTLVDDGNRMAANFAYWHFRGPLVAILDFALAFSVYAVYVRTRTGETNESQRTLPY